jgi:hypothetical protein
MITGSATYFIVLLVLRDDFLISHIKEVFRFIKKPKELESNQNEN